MDREEYIKSSQMDCLDKRATRHSPDFRTAHIDIIQLQQPPRAVSVTAEMALPPAMHEPHTFLSKVKSAAQSKFKLGSRRPIITSSHELTATTPDLEVHHHDLNRRTTSLPDRDFGSPNPADDVINGDSKPICLNDPFFVDLLARYADADHMSDHGSRPPHSRICQFDLEALDDGDDDLSEAESLDGLDHVSQSFARGGTNSYDRGTRRRWKYSVVGDVNKDAVERRGRQTTRH